MLENDSHTCCTQTTTTCLYTAHTPTPHTPAQLRAALQSQAEEYESLAKQLSKRKDSSDLKSQLKAAQATAQEATGQLEAFRQQLQEREGLVTTLQGQLRTLQEQVNTREDALRTANDTVEELTARLEAATSGQGDVEALQQELREATAAVADLQGRLDQLAAEGKEAKERVGVLEEEASRAEVEKQKLLNELSEWQDAVNDLEGEVDRQKGTVKTLREQMEQLEKVGVAAEQAAADGESGELGMLLIFFGGGVGELGGVCGWMFVLGMAVYVYLSCFPMPTTPLMHHTTTSHTSQPPHPTPPTASQVKQLSQQLATVTTDLETSNAALADAERKLGEALEAKLRLQEEVKSKEEGLRSLKKQMEEQKVAVENLGQKSAANADQVCL